MQKVNVMEDKLKPEEVWYLKKMMELSEKALAEGKTYTHEEVKSLIKARLHDNYVAATSVG